MNQASLGTGDFDALLVNFGWTRRLAHALVRDPALAEDLSQEVALTVWSRTRQGEGSPSRGFWRRALMHALWDRLRRRDTRREHEGRAARPEDSVPGSDETAERMEAYRCLAGAVAGLPEPQRKVVVLRYEQGLTGAEIARRAGIPASTVRARLSRGLQGLRDELGIDGSGSHGGLLLAPLLGAGPSPQGNLFTQAPKLPSGEHTLPSRAGTAGNGTRGLAARGLSAAGSPWVPSVILATVALAILAVWSRGHPRPGTAGAPGSDPAVNASTLPSMDPPDARVPARILGPEPSGRPGESTSDPTAPIHGNPRPKLILAGRFENWGERTGPARVTVIRNRFGVFERRAVQPDPSGRFELDIGPWLEDDVALLQNVTVELGGSGVMGETSIVSIPAATRRKARIREEGGRISFASRIHPAHAVLVGRVEWPPTDPDLPPGAARSLRAYGVDGAGNPTEVVGWIYGPQPEGFELPVSRGGELLLVAADASSDHRPCQLRLGGVSGWTEIEDALRFERGAHLEGRLQFRNSRPSVGERVEVTRLSTDGESLFGQMVWTREFTFEWARRSRWVRDGDPLRMAGLQPGAPYRVRADFAATAPTSLFGAQAFPSSDGRGLRAVGGVEGTAPLLDFELQVEEEFHLIQIVKLGDPGPREGTSAVDALGSSAPVGRGSLRIEAGRSRVIRQADEEGRVLTRVDPERELRITARVPGFASRTLVVPANAAPGTFTLELRADPEQVPGEVWVHLLGDPECSIEELRMELRPLNGDGQPEERELGMPGSSRRSPRNGSRFRFLDLPPGRYAATLAPANRFRDPPHYARARDLEFEVFPGKHRSIDVELERGAYLEVVVPGTKDLPPGGYLLQDAQGEPLTTRWSIDNPQAPNTSVFHRGLQVGIQRCEFPLPAGRYTLVHVPGGKPSPTKDGANHDPPRRWEVILERGQTTRIELGPE